MIIIAPECQHIYRASERHGRRLRARGRNLCCMQYESWTRVFVVPHEGPLRTLDEANTLTEPEITRVGLKKEPPQLS